MEKATELLHQGTAQVGANPWLWVVAAVVIAAAVFWFFGRTRSTQTDVKLPGKKYFND